MELAEDADGLPGQRHDVRLAHLHPSRPDSPLGMLSVQVDPGPLGGAKLSGAHGHVGRKFQRRSRRRLAIVAVDGPQQLSDLCRIDDRGMVLRRSRWQCSPKIGSDVVLRASGRDRVPEASGADLARAMRRIDDPLRLDTLQNVTPAPR